MKNLLIGAALTLGAAISAQAADAAVPFKFVLGAGLTSGGDTLATLVYTDGSSDSVKGGNLATFYLGGEFRVGTAVSVQATIGYHTDRTKDAENGSVQFNRTPVDLLAYYHLNDKVRLGGGAQFVSSSRLKGSGAASSIDVPFDSTIGGVIEGEYLFSPHMGIKLRSVTEKFNLSGGGGSASGNHIGVLFNFYL